MAELASGAVNSLLGVIRDEARLLSAVRGDVQFIKEEMESMNCFLAHLARTAPPDGDHDEQVRGWMNQVRALAQDCNNCIGIYRYYGNPDIHLARDGLRRYVWWLPWFVRRMAAQHDAALRLRELKDRARDVGERRLRYGVEVPARAVGLSSQAAGSFAFMFDNDDDEDDGNQAATSRRRRAKFELGSLDDYFRRKLVHWMKEANRPKKKQILPSIAVMTPDDARQLADEVLAVAKTHFKRNFLVQIPEMHSALGPFDILYCVLHEIQLCGEKSQPQQEGTSAGQCEVEEQKLDRSKMECQQGLPRRPWGQLRHIRRGDKFQPQQEGTSAGQCEVEEQKLDRFKMECQQGLPRRPRGQLRHITRGDKFQPQQEGTSAGRCKVKEQELERYKSQNQQRRSGRKLRHIRQGKFSVLCEIMRNIREMKVPQKIQKIKSKIVKIRGEDLEQELEHMRYGGDTLEVQSFDVLWHALCLLNHSSDAAARIQVQSRDGDIFDKTATMLKEHMERHDAEQPQQIISLHKNQYVDILKDVFPTINKPSQAEEQATSATKTSTSTTTSLGGDQISELIDKIKLELRQELHEYKSETEQATRKQAPHGQLIPDAVIEETNKKFEVIQLKIRVQLIIKWMLDKIEDYLKEDETTLIIIHNDKAHLPGWEDTITALNLLDCIAGVVMVITTENSKRAKRYCSPSWEPINYSRAGQYYDKVLELTSKKTKLLDTKIVRDILEECELMKRSSPAFSRKKEECEPHHELSMKIFAHALYYNPIRSNEELLKLHNILQGSRHSPASFLMKMFKFSYSDLPKEYRSCLLYLAIFRSKDNIRQSTLLGRWVVEGLITKKDWPSSVRQAETCFDLLIDLCLVDPGDIGATGNIKSCKVSGRVHQLITKIARSQHIVEARLSHHLARHFSIFNDLRLCGSDSIHNFFEQLISEKSQLSMIKILDLEGCHCSFKENPHYLEVICNKLLLLKYLSLRGTDITKLPNEINKLYELEVLDIRQTSLPAPATKHVVLLKLKRLLAGHRGMMTGSNVGAEEFSSVRIPENIGKMENMEVLSNVKAKDDQELKDIGRLWRLRKFDVVIVDKKSHLQPLLEAISNLHECLKSLSITLLPTNKGSIVLQDLEHIRKNKGLEHFPNHLKSLSINGTVQNGQLLPLLAGGVNQQLGKVTLSNTLLNQDGLDVLAKLKKLCHVELRNIACTEGRLNFKKKEFSNLSYFLVEGFHKQGSKLTKIIFEDGAARKLEKIVLSQTCIESICGVEMLPKMREVKFNGDTIPINEIQKVINTLTNKQSGFVFKHDNSGNQGEAMGNEQEKDDGAGRFFCC